MCLSRRRITDARARRWPFRCPIGEPRDPIGHARAGPVDAGASGLSAAAGPVARSCRRQVDLRPPRRVMTLASVGPEEFRRAGHELVDWVADYRLKVAGRPRGSPVAPGEVAAALPASPPEVPEPLEAIIADLDRIIVPGLTHIQHPRNFAW